MYNLFQIGRQKTDETGNISSQWSAVYPEIKDSWCDIQRR